MSTRGIEAQKLNYATPSDATYVAPLPAIAPPLDGTALHAAAVVGHADPITVQPERNMIGRWSTGLCACCSDCCTFLTVFCIPCVPIAQLAHQFNAFGMKPSCKLVAALLGVVWIYQHIIQPVQMQKEWADGLERAWNEQDCWKQQDWKQQDWKEDCGNEQQHASEGHDLRSLLKFRTVSVIMTFIMTFICLIKCLIVMNVRAKIRAADRIPTGKICCCDEDCCCACCCQPCTICQMLRHVLNTSQGSREHTGMQYNVCSENVVAV